MCVLINPEVVISNAFFARKHEETTFLETSALQEFCNIVYEKITGSTNGRNNKYVYFQVDDVDMDEFCSCNERYVKGINKIYATEIIQSDELNKVNSIYDKDIQRSLAAAREVFSSM